jgi:Fusaric acid resistance protein-like
MTSHDLPLYKRLRSRPELLDPQRRSELVDAATSWSRVSARGGLHRVRGALWPSTQTALAAGIGWLIASEILGHPRPFFAPVAAIIALGVMRGQRARRAVELLTGVTLGVGLSDLVLATTGRGVIALVLAVICAMTAAMLLNAGQVMLTEAAVSAALVATVAPTTQGFPPTRLLDALVGGGVALVFSQLLFPVDPVRLVRQAAETVLDQLADTLDQVAGALENRDLDAAERALMQARRTGDAWARFDQALDVGLETARFAPRRRDARKRMTDYEDVGLPLELTVRDVHVLARGAVRALMIDDDVPGELVDAIRDLASAFERVAGRMGDTDRADRARQAALRATRLATQAVPAQEQISVNVLAGYTQATAADLLRTLGLERERAHEAVGREAAAAGDPRSSGTDS